MAHPKNRGFDPLKTGIIGSLIAALCCFTPILTILLGVLGLAGLTGFLDFVLFPVLFIFLGLTAYGLFRQRRTNIRKEFSHDQK
jgi:mercuric ion transport protein